MVNRLSRQSNLSTKRAKQNKEKNKEQDSLLINYFNEFTSEFKKQTKTVREELDEHLEVINQNTNEIQSNYEYTMELNAKLDKLHERLDELQLFVEKQFGLNKNSENKSPYCIMPLTSIEQEVFLCVYSAEHSTSLSYKDIARNLGMTDNLTQNYIGNLISKGIPVQKRFIGNITYLSLDIKFKNIQAKHNIVKINEDVSKRILAKTALN